MNLWSSLKSLFHVDSANQVRTHKGKKALELKPRNHIIEQCEDRVLLSVSPTGLDDVYGSEAIRQAIVSASNLEQYESVDMSNVTKWVVGVSSQTDIDKLAGRYGATNNGATLLSNSYVWEFSTSTAWETAADYLKNATGVDYFYPLVTKNVTVASVNDPLFENQWGLAGYSTTNAGINAEGAWKYVTGDGINIAVLDQGSEYSHEDLLGNYDATLSHDFIDNDDDPTPIDTSENHGTAVTGIIVAKGDNNTGGTGVAYDATFGSIRLIADEENAATYDLTAEDFAQAFVYGLDNVDIYNNSWGNSILDTESYIAYYSYIDTDPLEDAALEKGITEGRDGKGAIYIFAAGNDGEGNIDVNMSGYTNSRYTITVGAVNQDGTRCAYSNTGAALLVVAPSGGDTIYDSTGYLDHVTLGTTTTDRTGEAGYNTGTPSEDDSYYTESEYANTNYTNRFNGTSAATPVVSGVVALMLDANPNLTWRDVQQILVKTSVQNDIDSESWTTNGAGYHISYDYGFGLVNAQAAVEAALTWENLSEELHLTAESEDTPVTIGKGCSSTITIDNKSIGALETVEVTVNITHPKEGDLEIILVSPDGTESILAQSRQVEESYGGYDNYTFSTVRCWGEMATGDWTLKIVDNGSVQSGVLNSWSIDLYGNEGDIAKVGPDVVAVFPDADGSLLENPTLDYAPTQLTVRFTEGQTIDADSLSAISLMYRQNESSEWEEVSLGWIGIGEQSNEVILRPASTFLDGQYKLVIKGTGDLPLTNDKGFEFRYDAETGVGADYTLQFNMTLPVQVTAVVPMPVVDGEVQSDQIEVYFSADKSDNANFETVDYYTLFATEDSVTSNDDKSCNPESVTVDTVIDSDGHSVMRATLTFADDINKLFKDEDGNYIYGAYRLKVGETYATGETTEYEKIEGEEFEAGDSFGTSTDVSDNFASEKDVYSSVVINGNIDVQKANDALQAMIEIGMTEEEIQALYDQVYDYDNRWPGGNDEPGHRLQSTVNEKSFNGEQHISDWDYDSYDATPGVVTYFYSFPKSGVGDDGKTYYNSVTEEQKDSIRDIFQLLADCCGIQCLELKTPTDGTEWTSVTYNGTEFPVINFFVGDLALSGGTSGPGGVAGLGGGTRALLDIADYGNTGDCEYGSGFYTTAMHEIMHCLGQGHTYDLDSPTIMGSSTKEFYTTTAESVFPAPADTVHLQYLFRNDSIDIDMYKFTLQQAGTLELETIARRLEESSGLDTVLNLYDESGTLIATNDNYFGSDSLIEVTLTAGTYYVGVSSVGNEDYDPVNEKTGMDGTTEGEYQLKMSFTPAQKASTLLNFDGDMDGEVGGDFNFWFDVQADENVFYVDKTGEFTPDNGTDVYTQIDEAVEAAAARVEELKNADSDERVIVRILANNVDNKDLTQRKAYEIGTYSLGGITYTLEDGASLDIPKGVSIVVEEGAIIKLSNTNITAGSTTAVGPVNNVLDQTPAGTIQLLGSPEEKVYLTSYWDEMIGSDSYTQVTEPKAGDWGGIVLTNTKEHDYNEGKNADGEVTDETLKTVETYGKVKILEDEGIYINYIGFADISYGGGEVNVNGNKSVYAAIYLDEARPTILSNTISSSMTAAISADPTSFEESHFYGQDDEEEGGEWYTADYDRVGPTIHNNTLVKTHQVKKIDKAAGTVELETVTSSNSVNGLAIRTTTQNGTGINKLDVTARFDDWDITHVIQEDLILASAAGGAEVYVNSTGKTYVDSRVGGSLRVDDNVLMKLGNTRIELESGANLIAEGTAGDEIIFTSIYDDMYGYGGTFDVTNNGFNADCNQSSSEYNPENNDYLTGGNWAGLYLNLSSSASLDNIKLMYAGGQSKIEGYFVNFQPIEVVQADLRITNSYLAYNAAVTETSDRVGRGSISNPAVIYVRNCQPIIVGNNFVENDTSIISINANALTADVVKDSGRQTGLLIKQEDGAKYTDLYTEYSDNYGPMVRDNEFNDNLYNGMVVRGETLTTESIWDDTDIVHLLFDEITVGNHHTYSGLRLQSSTTASLVVKLYGNNAGFTATGSATDIEDRIGGTVQVIGNGTYPVILTSLYDNTFGAGYDQWGNSVTKTFTGVAKAADDDPEGEVPVYEAQAGDWRSIKFQQYSNDRNVAIVLETEAATNVITDANNTLKTAQNLGTLADNLEGGDENSRLGFDIHGTIHSNRDSEAVADSDIYMFKATAGTDVWVDVDLTRYALDTVVELLDASGNVVARNSSSEDITSWLSYTAMISEELYNLSAKEGKSLDKIDKELKKESNFRDALVATMQAQYYTQYYQSYVTDGVLTEVQAQELAKSDAQDQYTYMTGYDWTTEQYEQADGTYADEPDADVTTGLATSMNDDIWTRNSNDDYGLNEKDSGFKVTLPGATGVETQYYLRVYSNTTGSDFYEGRSYGEYEIQIRLQETQEKAGCTVQYAQIYYATNGIEVIGTPSSSPLTVDTTDVEIGITGSSIDPSGTGQNDTFKSAQNLGNVLETSSGSISLTGYAASSNDVDWYKFEVKIPGQQNIPGVNESGNGEYPLTIDMDYSDGLGREDVNIWLFDSDGTLIASSTGSNITGDQATPFNGSDTDNLNAGSTGSGDSFIGTFYVPEGTYYIAVAPSNMTPNALSQQLSREESIDSVNRIVEDNVTGGGLTGDTYAYQLNFQAEDYTLEDVRLYIGTKDDLFSYNSLTGEYECDWTTTTDTNRNTIALANDKLMYYGDYVMRSDGRLYAIDNRTGNLQEISLEDARNLTTVNNLGTVGYILGKDGLERISDTYTQVNYEAIIFAHEDGTDDQYNTRPMFVVGNIGTTATEVDYTQNLLYMVNSDGTTHSLEGGEGADEAKAGTNDVPMSYLLTGRQLITPAGTDDSVISMDGDVQDGHQITIQMKDDTGLEDVILEFDTGVDLALNSIGGLKIRDGQTFTIAGKTFEFDSGPVIEIADGATPTDGEEIVLSWTDDDGKAQTLTIFFSDGSKAEEERAKAPDGAQTVEFVASDTSMTLTLKIVAAMQKGGVSAIAGWNDANENLFKDADEIGRISFTGLTGLGIAGTGWATQVAYEGVEDGNIAVTYSEWTATETADGINEWMENLDQHICDVINENIDGVDATFYHREITLNKNKRLEKTVGDRITIANLNAEEFSVGSVKAEIPVTDFFTMRDNVLTGDPSSAGVTEGDNILRIRVDADSTGADLSRRIVKAIEDFKLNNRDYEDVLDVVVSGKNVEFTGELSGTISNDDDVFKFEGDINGKGGKITGLAWSGDDLYAITEKGDLFRVTYNDGAMSNFNVRDVQTGKDADSDRYRYGTDNATADAATTDWDIIYEERTQKNGDDEITYYALCKNEVKDNKTFELQYITSLGESFTGLTNGPENVEDTIYADLLFAVDKDGVVYCFNTDGEYQGIFADGASSIDTGKAGAVGLDFTTQDFNLWHTTNQRDEDAGHTLNSTFDNLRKVNTNIDLTLSDGSQYASSYGGTSIYFGIENPRDEDEYIGYNQGSITQTLRAYNTNTGLFDTYNAAGGTKGSMVSDEFSLNNVSSGDLPYMTFDYLLDTEDSSNSVVKTHDIFRVYIRCTDVTSAEGTDLEGGDWVVISSNVDNAQGVDVGGLSDTANGWIQGKVDLSAYAGMSNLQLKIEFTTASTAENDERLYATEALNIDPEDTFSIDNVTFTFNCGQKLSVNSTPAARIGDDETATMTFTNGDGEEVTVNVSKIDEVEEVGVSYAGGVITIYIAETTTAAELANLLTEGFNEWGDENAVDAQWVKEHLLTEGAIAAEMYNIVGLNNGITLTSDTNGLVTTIGTGTVEGDNLVEIDYTMSSTEVAAVIADALEAYFSDATEETAVDDLWTVVKVDEHFTDQLHLVNHRVTDAGPLTSADAINGATDDMAQGQDNKHEGVYLDNFCIMLSGRGSMYTAVTSDTTFSTGTQSGPTSGYYQLNIRTGTDYGTYDQEQTQLTRIRTFNTTDRLDGGLSIVVPEVESINHLSMFTIGDGNSEQRFVMVNEDVVDELIASGEYDSYDSWYEDQIQNDVIRSADIVVKYTNDQSSYEVAQALTSAVNTKYLETVDDTTYRGFTVRANYSGSTNRVDLYDATWIKGLAEINSNDEATSMSFINFNGETASYQDMVNGTIDSEDKSLVNGDDNVTSGQGQIIISNNLIAYSSEYGIYSAGNKADTTGLWNGIDVFALESNADAKYTIYLDFTGHTATGTGWGAEVVTPSYDSNLQLIYEVWERISEDFMPWDVNVTTVEPTAEEASQAGFIRVCIGGSWQDWFGKSAGGVAFVGSFSWASDTPAYVFANDLGSAKNIAEAASHEIGHTFGLSHDGDPSNEYYSGSNGWGPIMGTAYSQILSQWSKGEYAGATNKEDDVQKITDVISALQKADGAENTDGVRVDEHGDSAGTATDLGTIAKTTNGTIESGIITTAKDVDWFKFDVEADCTQKVIIGGIDQITNLDCGVRLYNANGTEIKDGTIVQEVGLQYNINLDQLVAKYGAGTYRMSIEGTGSGQASTGDEITSTSKATYSDYGSLGAYTIYIQKAADDVTVDEDAPAATFPGFIAAFPTINSERWVPSTVMTNNILAYNETGGIYFGGNSNSSDIIGTVPYGRIVNNTVWGTADNDTGITVGNNATATVLNNVVANCSSGIAMDGSVSSTIVSGYNAYYGNKVNTSGGASVGSNALLLRTGESLFVNPEKLNFYPASQSRIIDSSVNAMDQRVEMDKLYDQLGISTSPIFAPDTDIYGQVRADDPAVQSAAGTGSNTFKDRGAVERIDWVGPVASIINPVDLYDTEPSEEFTDDSNLNRNDVELTGVTLNNFVIDFTDEGVGIDDDTVTEKSVTVYRILNGYERDAAGNFIDAKAAYLAGATYVEKLDLTYDYLFRYNATLDRITLIPVTGSWTLGYTYQIELCCDSTSQYCIYDLAGNELQANRATGAQVGRTVFNISLSGLNFGDAPDEPTFPEYHYQSYLANDGAAHIVTPGFCLGETVIATADAIVNKDATASADDDGVEFQFKDGLLSTVENNTITITVRNDAIEEEQLTTEIAGYVCVWIDIDGDGYWGKDGTADYFFMKEAYVGENEFTINAADLAGGAEETFMRVRLFSVETVEEAIAEGADFSLWYGGSRDELGEYIVNPIVKGGEVEDYKVYLVDKFYDYGDTPLTYGDAKHEVANTKDDYIYLGTEDDGLSAGIDAEYAQHYSTTATGDDNYGKLDATGNVINDEQGVEFDIYTLTPGEYAKLTVNTQNTMTGYLYVWLDTNNDGIFQTDECIVNGTQITESGEHEIYSDDVLPEVGGLNFNTMARVRFSAEELTSVGTEDENGADLGAIGFGGLTATRGEVEDYQVLFSSYFYDFGDAPDTYKTLSESDGPYHQLTDKDDNGNRSVLGTEITAELDGQPSERADADQGDDGLEVNEETGYVKTIMTPGKTVSMPVTVTGQGYIQMWIDYNANGEFSDSERVTIESISQQQEDGTYAQVPEYLKDSVWGYRVGNYDGTYGTTQLLVTFTIPETAQIGETYMRVRYYDEANLTDEEFSSLKPSATGFGGYGEVEDYMVNIQRGVSVIEGYKFNDENGNGVYDYTTSTVINEETGEAEIVVTHEAGIRGIAVYLDLNEDGIWNAGEDVAVTNALGYYKFENQVSGTYIVREVFSVDDLSVVDAPIFYAMYPDARVKTAEEADLWIQTYPQRVASIPENDASNTDVATDKKAFTFAFRNDGNISLDGCHVFVTNYGYNYEDDNPVTYDFIITTTKGMISTNPTTIYVYYDANSSDPMYDLAKSFAKAVNTLSTVGMTAASSENRVTIASGVYDLRISNGDEQLLPTGEGDVAWFKIQTSHSMPVADETATHGGYQVVVVSKEGTYSGVNFGNYRKPEVDLNQTDMFVEGSTGWRKISVPVTITESFGSEITIQYETTDGTAHGYVREDYTTPVTETEKKEAAQDAPYIDFIHASGETTITVDKDKIVGGGWDVTQITKNSTDDNYETKVAGDYVVFRKAQEIYYYNLSSGIVPVQITDDDCNDAYLDAAELDNGDVVATWSKYNKETGKWQLYYHFLEGGSTTSSENGTLIDLPNSYDYYTPIIGNDSLYFVRADKIGGASGQALMVINGWDNIKESEGSVFPTEVFTCSETQTIPAETIHVNLDDESGAVDSVVFCVKDSKDGSTYVYYKKGSDSETDPVCLTEAGVTCSNPQIDGQYIVWQEHVANTSVDKVVLYDILTGTKTTIRETQTYEITDNTGTTPKTTKYTVYTNNVNPVIDNNTVVWAGEVYTVDETTNATSKTTEILMYSIKSGETVQISDGNGRCSTPSIKDDQIAWTQEVLLNGNYDKEIITFSLENLELSPIYPNGRSGNDWEPTVCADGTIIWRGYDSTSGHYELFLAKQTDAYYTAYVDIWVYADTIIEDDEYFYMNITTEQDNVIINNDQTQIWLLNDDSSAKGGSAMDYGDAPDNYEVNLEQNGARHNYSAKSDAYYLGSGIDYESNSKTNASATGDKYDDGVAELQSGTMSFVPGMVYTLTVTANVPEADEDGIAYLDAWIDFDGDGYWTDDERIADSLAVVDGQNEVTFLVPYTPYFGDTFARFRISADGGLDSTGYASTGEVEDYKVVTSEKLDSSKRTLTITGTEADEQFEFQYSDDQTQFAITKTVNGEVRYAFLNGSKVEWIETPNLLNVSDYDLIRLSGSTGEDKFNFIGSDSSKEIYKLYQNKGFIYSNGLNINFENFNSMDIDANGGEDTISLLGSGKQDKFNVGTDSANVTNADGSETYYQVNHIDSTAMVFCYGDVDEDDEVVMATAQDRISQADFTRNDLVISDLTGIEYRKAIGFKTLTVSSTNENEKVVFNYVTGKIDFDVEPVVNTDREGTFVQQAYGFDIKEAKAASTSAVLKVSAQEAGDLVLGTDQMTFTGASKTILAEGFSNVEFDGNGYDVTAAMYDSEGDDVVTMYANNVQMKGQNYLNVVKNVKFVNAYSTSGNDTAKIYDTADVNYLYAQAYSTTIFDAKKSYSNSATGFATVQAYSTYSNSKAYLYDSVGNDVLVSTSTCTSLSGKAFSNKVYGYNTIQVSSVNGGNDVARLYDSAVDDVLSAGTNWAQIDSVDLGQTRKVSNFNVVEAVATNGGSKTVSDATSAKDFVLNTYGWED